MGTYSNNLVDVKMKQKVLSPYNFKIESSRNHIYQNVDELPLPPPPVGLDGKFSLAGQRGHLQFPLPPPDLPSANKQSQDAMANVNSKGVNYYENIPKMTRTYDSIYEPIQAKLSDPKWICSSDSSQTPLYANLISQTSANNNSACNSTSPRKSFVRKQTADKSQTAIYANLVNNTPFITSGSHKQSPNSIKNYLRVNRLSGTKEEEEVDHLTDLLVKSMENSAEPDFFGMCNKCGEKVVGEGSGCTAMEMVYHIQCFTCHVCRKELRGKPFYAMESNPYCEECYLNTLEKCCVCEKPILDRILRATGKPYHPSCFTCVVCHKCLDGIPFTVDDSNQIHCIDDFHKKFAPRCSVCKEPIVPEPGKTETVRVVALDRSFHVSCYKCEDCDLLLSSETEGRGCYPLDDHILCRGCNAKRVQAITAN